MNKKGTPLLKALLFEHRLPWRYYIIKREFIKGTSNFFTLLTITPLLFLKGYRPIKKEHVKGNRFFVFINKKNKLVIKIPRKFGPVHSFALKNPENFKKYSVCLTGLESHPSIQKHMCKVIKIFRSGGYISSYIEGYNMQILLNQLKDKEITLKPELKRDILKAIQEIIQSLEESKKEGKYPFGDWLIRNLIYDTRLGRIINVDLEGFYLHDKNVHALTSSIEKIKEELNESIKILRD